MLTVKGKHIVLNNFFISGIFEIKKEVPIEKNNEFKISTNKSPIKISEDKLIQHFRKIGLDDVEIETKGETILVYFKKGINLN